MESTQQKGITTNIYTPSRNALSYMKHLLTDLTGDIEANTVVAGTLTPHSLQQTDWQGRNSARKQQISHRQ